jgi:hypothetical protein
MPKRGEVRRAKLERQLNAVSLVPVKVLPSGSVVIDDEASDFHSTLSFEEGGSAG